jgi:hypothetical protein
MNGDLFWSALEYRVSDELTASRACAELGLWCDGFLPTYPAACANHDTIEGQVWLGFGPRGQECWSFVATVQPGLTVPLREADWSHLLPDEDDDWLSVDIESRQLSIRLGRRRP